MMVAEVKSMTFGFDNCLGEDTRRCEKWRRAWSADGVNHYAAHVSSLRVDFTHHDESFDEWHCYALQLSAHGGARFAAPSGPGATTLARRRHPAAAVLNAIVRSLQAAWSLTYSFAQSLHYLHRVRNG
jgi:hypothetical protein